MLAKRLVEAAAATALVSEVAQAADLPVYNAERVAAVIDDVVEIQGFLDDEPMVTRVSQGIRDPGVAGNVLTHVVLDRHLRALAIYHYERLQRILANLDGPQLDQPNATEAEQSFARKYKALRRKYLLDTGIDSWVLLQVPPGSAWVEVMCERDLGEVVLTSGEAVRMPKGSVHFMLRSEAERYIAARDVTVIDENW